MDGVCPCHRHHPDPGNGDAVERGPIWFAVQAMGLKLAIEGGPKERCVRLWPCFRLNDRSCPLLTLNYWLVSRQ